MATTTALILYDTTGQWGWLGELYAIMTANLASHFGSWTAEPVVSYKKGQVNQFTAVIYIGSTYGEPIPTVFLTDVLATTTPVIWVYDNIWQLTGQDANFFSTYGWIWAEFDYSTIAQVNYKGQALTRYSGNNAGIMSYFPLGSGVTTLATCVRSDSSTFPWALRSRNLTYIGENPLTYIAEGDRYLAFCDLLFDALAPATVTRHRATVRLEDIDATADPNTLKSVANYLYGQGVPFGFQVIPLYEDPLGYYNNGVPETIHLKGQTALISALKFMQTKGGVMIMHGYTHQYSNVYNPYTGVSGDDAEFFRLTLNSDETIDYVGLIPGDSTSWAQGRITSGKSELAAAGFAAPSLWTFPSYLGSAADIGVIRTNFTARAERSLYYSGSLSGTIDPTRYVGQFMPYTVQDVYNTKVLADTLGGIQPTAFYSTPPRLPAAIVAAAQQTLVVRDGVAGFFYNPDDPLTDLEQTVAGIKALGYTFVSPSSL